MAQQQVAPRIEVDPSVFQTPLPAHKPEAVPAPPPHPLSVLPSDRAASTSPANAQAGAAAAGLGELAKPATTQPAPDDAQARQHVTEQVEALKEAKHVLRPNDKGPDVVVLQQQLKQLGLHIKETGVMDKDTEAVIKAIQTGGGLGPDGIVGPKTLDSLLTLDKSSAKPDAQVGGAAAASDNVDHMPDDPKLAAVYLFNRMRAKNAGDNLTPAQEKDMEQFLANWDKNKARYEKVSETSGIPPKLVAALHWRESTGDFGTYLHQGDPLGKKAVHEPADIPIFKTWEPAAEHALGMKNSTQKAYKIDAHTTDEAALTSYAERYNGLGYHNYHAQASPYVFAGTDQYKKGKYVGDGDWDGNYKDTQLGVLSMMRRIDRHDHELAEKAAKDKANDPHPNQHFAQ
ncbi:MAG TPA: peptidoglycan-binding protein [Pseudomonadota bacterium]|nr:peptidoglycan-binding protein [Pseudomonadota bacterium]